MQENNLEQRRVNCKEYFYALLFSWKYCIYIEGLDLLNRFICIDSNSLLLITLIDGVVM